MRFICAIVILGLLNINMYGQAPDYNWYHVKSSDASYGLSTDQLYGTDLKNKPGQPVVVAVIDSGVDIEHEDLIGNIWINADEIPNNNIDDDQNGYIDDVNGWNFIGSASGENINGETLEVTRLYKKYKYKYENANPQLLNKEDKKEYEEYLKTKEEVEAARKKAEDALGKIETTANYIKETVNSVETALEGKELSLEILDSIDIEKYPESMTGIAMLKQFSQEQGTLPTFAELRSEIDKEFDGERNRQKMSLDYRYNPDFDSREIIGDDYDNQNERYYGNNDVKGPDAFHGTHVAGIIGALRGNDLGIDGVAQNVKIMSIRTVPDGDEHDKDVANAIRYAVENGASIINMSFGKGYAWNKDVVDDAVRYAEKNDVLLIHAAGNSAQDNDTSDNFPNDKYKKKKGFLFWKKKQAKNWIEVGAIGWKKNEELVAPFSNYGVDNVDVFAPGMYIYSTTPDSQYQIAQGTSMAAPMVAGMAAVLRSHFPALKAEQVKDILLKSSVKLNMQVIKPGTKDLVDFSTLSTSGGVVDLQAAYNMAKGTKGKKKIKKSKNKQSKA